MVAAHTILRWAYERKGMYNEALAAYEQERVFAGDTRRTRNGLMCWQQSEGTMKLASFCRRSWHDDNSNGLLHTRLRSFIAYWVIAIMRFNGSLKLSANMPWGSRLFASNHIWKAYDPIHASITCCVGRIKPFLRRVLKKPHL